MESVDSPIEPGSTPQVAQSGDAPCTVCGLTHEPEAMLVKRITFEREGEPIREVAQVKCIFCAEQDSDFTLVQP